MFIQKLKPFCLNAINHSTTNPKSTRDIGRSTQTVRNFSNKIDCDTTPRSIAILKPSEETYKAARLLPADLFFLDLQDGVPPNNKPSVRKLIARSLDENLFKDMRVVVRLNELAKLNELSEDLLAVLKHAEKIYGFVLPMLKTGGDVELYEEIISNMSKEMGEGPVNCRLFPIVETPQAVANVREIACASDLNTGIFFGDADLGAELSAKDSFENFIYARQKLVSTAHGSDVYPIDGAYTKFDDLIGLEKASIKAKDLGFVAKAAIHPKQLPIINSVFQPTKEEIAWAKRVKKSELVSRNPKAETREFFGPPHVRLADKILANLRASDETLGCHGVKPTLIEGGIDLNSCTPGSPSECQFELTVSEGFLTQWDSMVFSSDRISTSSHFAKKLGFKDLIVPNSLLMTLAASLAVSRFSESAEVHLSFKNSKYLKPVYPGDTLKGYFTVYSIRESSSQRYSIVKSHHILKNQFDEEVYQLEKWSLFPRLDHKNIKIDPPSLPSTASPFHEKILSLNIKELETFYPTNKLKAGNVLIHRLGKTFGGSEVMALCNSIRATNSHHYNTNLFRPEEILVPGPFSVHTSLACAKLDLGEILYEEVLNCNNLIKVNHKDVINSITYIKSIESIPENPGLERVVLVTLGLKNINMTLLAQESFPIELFHEENSKISTVNSICSKSIKMLCNRIACKTEYMILRKAQKEK